MPLRDEGVGDAADQRLVDRALERVPRVPAHRRRGRRIGALDAASLAVAARRRRRASMGARSAVRRRRRRRPRRSRRRRLAPASIRPRPCPGAARAARRRCSRPAATRRGAGRAATGAARRVLDWQPTTGAMPGRQPQLARNRPPEMSHDSAISVPLSVTSLVWQNDAASHSGDRATESDAGAVRAKWRQASKIGSDRRRRRRRAASAINSAPAYRRPISSALSARR